MKQKYFSIAGMLAGMFSIVMSFVVKTKDIYNYEYKVSYGGDAYTGIQNAAASTANNVGFLSNLVAYGIFAILLVFGLVCIVYFGKKLLEELEEEKLAAKTEETPKGSINDEKDEKQKTNVVEEKEEVESKEEFLKEYKALFDEGIITEEEFEFKQKELLE